MKEGCIHLYYGDGKGKTTAAVGLAVRMAGNKGRVCFAQFMKGGYTGELVVLEKLEQVQICRASRDFPFYHQMNNHEKEEITHIHNEILEQIISLCEDDMVDMVVLDEITFPVALHLIDEIRLKEFLQKEWNGIELVLTGREPSEEMLERAHYITEMKGIRHPYQKGIPARRGIEY